MATSMWRSVGANGKRLISVRKNINFVFQRQPRANLSGISSYENRHAEEADRRHGEVRSTTTTTPTTHYYYGTLLTGRRSLHGGGSGMKSPLLQCNGSGKLMWTTTTMCTRQNSTQASSSAAAVGDVFIPPPPAVPIEEVVASLGSSSSLASDVLTEPSFASQGLGHWTTPVGILENAFEFLHVSVGLPWWGTIALGTLVVRICMFPLVVVAQKNAAKMHNNMPQMQALQLKMTEARKNGDALLAAKYGYEMTAFMKENDLNPFKNMLVPLAQAPVFLSFFMALRSMSNLPVESLKTGGLFWFTNLTIPDPFYLLPVITCTTLLVTIELGVEGGIRADNMQMMRYVLRAMPFVIFPFTISFPAALLCYWTTSNFISLGQVALLKVPSVRQYFGLPPLAKHAPEVLPMKKKNMAATFKEAMTNAKIVREMQERSRVDEIRFRKAGSGPLQKTFPYNPTTQQAPPTTTTKTTHVTSASASSTSSFSSKKFTQK